MYSIEYSNFKKFQKIGGFLLNSKQGLFCFANIPFYIMKGGDNMGIKDDGLTAALKWGGLGLQLIGSIMVGAGSFRSQTNTSAMIAKNAAASAVKEAIENGNLTNL